MVLPLADSKRETDQQHPSSAKHALLKHHQRQGIASGYKTAAIKDGIPPRKHSLFPSDDALLAKLNTSPGLSAFEKHLPGFDSPYEMLPQGGWITGDAAAERGIDLRLYYKEPHGGETHGTVLGAVRFGPGAEIGRGFHLSAHGGAIETVLDEATAEIAKMEFVPFLSTREATFSIKKPVPVDVTLVVKAKIDQIKGLRCYVDGSIESEQGEVFATCRAQLVDMRPFIKDD